VVHALNSSMLATMISENSLQKIFFIFFLLNSDCRGFSTSIELSARTIGFWRFQQKFSEDFPILSSC